MSHHNSVNHREKTYRRHSPQHNRSSSHTNDQISQAQTSVDYHRDRKHQDRHRYDYRRGGFRNDQGRNYDQKRKDYSRDSYRKSYDFSRSRSFNQSHDSNHSLSSSRVYAHQEDTRQNEFHSHSQHPIKELREIKEMSQVQIQREKNKVIKKIQIFDYNSLQYEEIKTKFSQICGQYIKFEKDFPEATTQIGTLLLKDGLFHEMWSKVILKNKESPREVLLQKYYAIFKPMILKNLTNFQNTFNPIPDEEETISHTLSTQSFKRDRKAYEENTRSSTRTNVMILYEQVKAEIKNAEFQETMIKKIENSVQEFKLKIEETFQPIEDPYKIQWFDTAKAMQKINAQEEQEIRQAEIEMIKKAKIRQKSPLSNRFRMMHQVQSNQRRMAVEIACVFLNLNIFYNFSEIHIVKVDEVSLSENQEIIVVKAYSLDFCPMMGKMKLEPKLKNLIAVYKFSNLLELTRLVKTHGNFDGIIVYPQCFNVRKYLATSDELSLLKSESLDQIKEQIKKEFQEQLNADSRQY